MLELSDTSVMAGHPRENNKHPNSAKLLAPVHASKPDTSHTRRLAPTLWVLATTTPGEELSMLLDSSLRGIRSRNLQYSRANLTWGRLAIANRPYHSSLPAFLQPGQSLHNVREKLQPQDD